MQSGMRLTDWNTGEMCTCNYLVVGDKCLIAVHTLLQELDTDV
jgi:hypothetical protein